MDIVLVKGIYFGKGIKIELFSDVLKFGQKTYIFQNKDFTSEHDFYTILGHGSQSYKIQRPPGFWKPRTAFETGS